MPFLFDRLAISLLLAACGVLAARGWLHEHPQHNPWAPLNLADPPGWATDRKFSALRADRGECLGFLQRSGIEAAPLAPTGSGFCRREDRQVLVAPARAQVTLAPGGAQGTCSLDAGLAWWLRHGVQPVAETTLHSRVVGIVHLGTFNCRRIAGRESWSEHAGGNAIDIAAFVLADGRRISVAADWRGTDDAAAFLHTVRDRACRSFATVLSPDYNAAHGDHLHLDQARRTAGWSTCR